ncbi:MAG: bifunctional hydroxymethylpyrimidine kinase/phosphomethylpyrimidine kinase [Clostridiales bacterium]|nr:bifunctional hydroxymethylpyrimidine kinase/phosphomethylpyrimidine kinase [Clostridiales bacterium]
MKTVLTIAGSDCSGGAGIQADLKTMLANGVYGMSVITSLTAQNTTGVRSISNVNPEFLSDQIDMVFEDIVPDAVKTGMIPSKELVEVIAEKMRSYGVKNLVVDPVMVATSGADLSNSESVKALKEKLIPLSLVVTPNGPEAEVLSGMKINTKDDMVKAAEKISSECGCSVLIKGGHCGTDADDILYHDGGVFVFESHKIDNQNTHGTGCTLSSAIACNLAKGMTLPDAVKRAKEYITGAISAGLDLGHGRGPLDHGYDIKTNFKNI